MRISVERSVLLASLSQALGVVEKRSTIPILSHVQLTASGNGLSVMATDIDITLFESMQAHIEQDGGVAVPAQPFHDIIKKISDNVPLNLFVKDGFLHIHAGRSRFKLPFLPVDDFPSIHHHSVQYTWSMPVGVLCMLLNSTRFAMSAEEKRYHLNGICFHMAHKALFSRTEGMFLRAISTDLHRLACAEELFDPSFQDMPEFIMSRKTVQELSRLLEAASGNVDVSLCDARVEFAYHKPSGRGVFSARLVEGVFPDYQEAFSMQERYKLIVDTKDFTRAADRVAVLIDEKVRTLHLNACKNILTLSSENSAIGQAVEELDAHFPYDDDIKICLNVRFVLDIAHQIDTEKMAICIDHADTAVLFRPESDLLGKSFIVMPMYA